MARYRKIDLRISSDHEVRRLSRPQPNGQSLWMHLLTGRETGIIPGVFAARESGMAEELGWSLEGFRKAFAEVSGEAFGKGCSHGARKPLAIADWSAGFIWIPKAIKHNPPQSPNVIRSWADAWDELPECDLKADAYEGLSAFVKGMGEGFREAFDEAIPKPSWMPLPKARANQEQEQEQDKNPTAAKPPRAKKKSQDPDPEWLADFKREYPDRNGGQEWRKAVRAAKARIDEGHSPDEFIAGAKRYHTHCKSTDKIGTQYVKQAATFLGPDKPFLDPWPAAVPKPARAAPQPVTTLQKFPATA